MAKLRKGQKAVRVLKFLLGLRNPRALGMLVTRGFREENAEEGWRLLRNLGKLPFDDLLASERGPNPLKQLDAWENDWFPVADATLARNFPKVHESVFLNLTQAAGNAVVLSVGTFLDRVTALRHADEQSQKAARLLARRGLTDGVLAEARSLLTQLGSAAPGPAPLDPELARAELRAAEAEVWGWYLEWSRLARGVIKERGLLRELGFLGGSDDEGSSEDEANTAIPSGAASSGAASSGAASRHERAAVDPPERGPRRQVRRAPSRSRR